MSDTTTRVPLHDADLVAAELLDVLAPACERIQIAGSIRRRRPDVGDVELVAVPKIIGVPGLFEPAASHGRLLSVVHREAVPSTTTLVNADLSAATPHCPHPFRTFVDAGCGQRPRQHEERPRHSRLLRPIEYSEASS